MGSGFKVNHSHAIQVAFNSVERADAAHCPTGGCTLTQPFVKFLTVDHAYKAVVDWNVNLVVFRRDHAGRCRARNQQLVWYGKVFNEPGRNGAAARFDTACAVQQQD